MCVCMCVCVYVWCIGRIEGIVIGASVLLRVCVHECMYAFVYACMCDVFGGLKV